MRPIVALTLSVVVLVAGGCHRGVPPAELARTTPYDLARKEGHYVTIDGLQVFAITAGHGRDVVLIHGNPSSTYTWRKVVAPLAKHLGQPVPGDSRVLVVHEMQIVVEEQQRQR